MNMLVQGGSLLLEFFGGIRQNSQKIPGEKMSII